MPQNPNRIGWSGLFMAFAIAISVLTFVAGIRFGKSVEHCVRLGGTVAWQDWLRGTLLLLFLPTTLLGLKQPRMASHILFACSAAAFVVAISFEVRGAPGASPAVMGGLMLLTATLLRWRSASLSNRQV